MIQVHVGKQVSITGLPAPQTKKIKETLTLPNPAYFKMNKGGKRVWIKKEFTYYKVVRESLIVPRGVLGRVEKFLSAHKLEYKKTYSILDKEIGQKKTSSSVVVRDYQLPLLEQVLSLSVSKESVEGIIHAGTGAGKTVLGAELVHRLWKTTTIVVPTLPIMHQFLSLLKESYRIDVGQFGGGKKEIKDVTVAMVQSLKLDDPKVQELMGQTTMLIWDEVQNCVSDVRKDIIAGFSAKIMIGLTGSPNRTKDDGRTKAIGFLFGDVVAKYDMTLLSPDIKVMRTGADIPVDEYPVMIDAMVENRRRNRLIAHIATCEAMTGRKVLILTKRVKHYENIYAEFGDVWKEEGSVIMIDSKDKERNTILSELKTGDRDFSVVLGTTSLLAVGTDIPSFDTLLIACDLKSDVLVVQSAGRILRLFEGKQEPLIYDFVDEKNGILYNQFKQRLWVYKKKGWNVT